MSNRVLELLEEKIDCAIDTIELLRLQVEELEDKNQALTTENASLKSRQTQWEHSLNSLLGKLDGASLSSDKFDTRKVEHYEREEEDALV